MGRVPPLLSLCANSLYSTVLLKTAFCALQIYQVSPSTLLPVMPHIMSDLTAKEDAKRLSALELLGKLYALPDSDMHADFPELFKEFVRRSKDQKACPSFALTSFGLGMTEKAAS